MLRDERTGERARPLVIAAPIDRLDAHGERLGQQHAARMARAVTFQQGQRLRRRSRGERRARAVDERDLALARLDSCE